MVRRGVIGSLSATSSPPRAATSRASPRGRRTGGPAGRPQGKPPRRASMAGMATGTWERMPATKPSRAALAGGGSGGGAGAQSRGLPWARCRTGCMAVVEPHEAARVGRLLRRRPPAAALGWAAAPFRPGSRVVVVRPLPSAWLANHAVDVADAAGAVHRLVRRWAGRAGGQGPRLRRPRGGHPGAAGPRGAGAGAGRRRPGRRRLRRARPAAGPPPRRPARPRRRPAPLVEGLAAALPSVHAVPGPGPVPPYRRFYDPEQLLPRPGRTDPL